MRNVTSGYPIVCDVPALAENATDTAIRSQRNSIITCLWTFQAPARKEESLITFAVVQYQCCVATSLKGFGIPCPPGLLFAASIEAYSNCIRIIS
jgi:hypothetical protein